jgi:hypothetical protein
MGGDRQGARRALREAFEKSLRVGRVDLLSRAAIEFVGPTAPLEEGDESRARIEQCLSLLGAEDVKLRAELLLAFAHVYRHAHHIDPNAFAAAVEGAKSAAASLHDDDIQLQIVLRELQSLSWSDDIQKEEELCRRGNEVVSGRDDLPAVLTRSLLLRSYLERGLVNEEAFQAAEIANSARRTKRPFSIWQVFVHDGMRALREGDFEAANRSIRDAYSIGRFLDPLSEIVFFVQSLFVAREMLLTEEIRTMSLQASRFLQLIAHIPNSEVAVEHGRWLQLPREEALDSYRRFAQSDEFPHLYPDRMQGTVMAALLAEFAFEAQDATGAAKLAPWLRRWSNRMVVVADVSHICLGAMSAYLGLALTVLERWDEAEASFLDAIARDEAIRAPLWAQHARCRLAWMLARRGAPGDRHRAAELLPPVRSWAEAHGAKRLLQRVATVEDLLRSRRRADEGPQQLQEGAAARFSRDGALWSIGDGATTVQVRDSKGLHYLQVLLRHPGKPFRAAELAAMAKDEPGADPKPTDGATEGLGRRASEIASEVEEAARWNDIGRAETLRRELDLIEREISCASKQNPVVAETADRTRKAVTNRIRDAIQAIERELPALGEHLDRCIKTGASCSYEANTPKRWELSS